MFNVYFFKILGVEMRFIEKEKYVWIFYRILSYFCACQNLTSFERELVELLDNKITLI